MQQLRERPDNPRQPGQTRLTPEEGEYKNEYSPFIEMSDSEVRNLERERNPPWSEPTKGEPPLVVLAPEAKSIFNVMMVVLAVIFFLIALAMVAQWFVFHVG